jgi:hypothetical protein
MAARTAWLYRLEMVQELSVLLCMLMAAGCACSPSSPPASPADDSTPTACTPERDREAILRMSGTFDVDFDFRETRALVEGYEDGTAVWTSAETWRPLPRREYSKRDDYDVLIATNRHVIGPDGWRHEQQNRKWVIDEAHSLVEEEGLNVYRRDYIGRTIGPYVESLDPKALTLPSRGRFESSRRRRAAAAARWVFLACEEARF